ncbi:DUF4352 domain-containing protein [Staphylococcus shinii]|uniref:DUF4352 domain-containing protein n=1 Tax=Staphylococcus shinii TaxID=2912228 RepID=UPI003F54B21B
MAKDAKDLTNEELLARQQQQFEEYKEQEKKGKKKKWLWGCGGCLGAGILIIIVFAVISSLFFKGVDEELNGSKEEQDQISKTASKTYKVGDTVRADGIEVTLDSVEEAGNVGEIGTEPENGNALKVNFKFKNNNDDQILIDSGDFTINVNGEVYGEWFGTDDTNADFSHQINKDKTASGYIYYDVPDSDKYMVEMETMPNLKDIKAKWEIEKSDIQ